MEKQGNENSQIVIMLDLQGTLDGISDKLIKIFMNQLEFLRKKFKAKKAVIFISSQTEFREDLYLPAEFLKRNLHSNVVLDDCYFLDGTYNPNNGDYDYIYQVNSNKIKVLKDKYLKHEANTKFFAVVDDNLSADSLNEFQNECPFVLVRPSQHEDSLREDNFSCYSSCTYGFDGIIDALDRYIKNINSLTSEEIFEVQKNELFMISGRDISDLFEEEKFDQVLAYVENDKVIGMGYHELSYYVRQYLMKNNIGVEANEQIKKIAKLLMERLQAEKEKRQL